jgi:hypothetical protein
MAVILLQLWSLYHGQDGALGAEIGHGLGNPLAQFERATIFHPTSRTTQMTPPPRDMAVSACGATKI